MLNNNNKILLSLGKLKQKHHEFNANLGYIVSCRLASQDYRLCIKEEKKVGPLIYQLAMKNTKNINKSPGKY